MQKAWFGLAVVALLTVAWMGRYQFIIPSSGQGFFEVDRWTHTRDFYECRAADPPTPGPYVLRCRNLGPSEYLR